MFLATHENLTLHFSGLNGQVPIRVWLPVVVYAAAWQIKTFHMVQMTTSHSLLCLVTCIALSCFVFGYSRKAKCKAARKTKTN